MARPYEMEMTWFPLIFLFLLLVGISGWWNWQSWQRDRRRANELRHKAAVSPKLPNENQPLISFLVPAWNEQNTIRRCVEAILDLPYPNLELVVCAGGQDKTYSIAKSYRRNNVHILEQQPGEGKQFALQRCLDVSHGEIIYLVDADCVIEPDNFFNIIYPILADDVQVVSGSFYLPLVEQRQNPFVVSQAAGAAYAASRYTDNYSQGLLGGNCAVARTTLHRAGEFKNPVRSGTDYDLAKRLLAHNERIRYNPFGFILAEYPIHLRPYYRQQVRWIRNVVLHGLEYKAYTEVFRNLTPSFIGLLVWITPLIALLFLLIQANLQITLLLIFLWINLFGFAFLSRLRYCCFLEIWPGLRRPKGLLVLLPVYMMVDFFIWALALFEYPSKALRQRW